jgi:hypothetical protein
MIRITVKGNREDFERSCELHGVNPVVSCVSTDKNCVTALVPDADLGFLVNWWMSLNHRDYKPGDLLWYQRNAEPEQREPVVMYGCLALLFVEPIPVTLFCLGLVLIAAALIVREIRDRKIRAFYKPQPLISRWWLRVDARSDEAYQRERSTRRAA